MEPGVRECSGLSKLVLGTRETAVCIPAPSVGCALLDFLEQGLELSTLLVSCTGRKDNPWDVGLVERHLESQGQTWGWLAQQELAAFGVLYTGDAWEGG